MTETLSVKLFVFSILHLVSALHQATQMPRFHALQTLENSIRTREARHRRRIPGSLEGNRVHTGPVGNRRPLGSIRHDDALVRFARQAQGSLAQHRGLIMAWSRHQRIWAKGFDVQRDCVQKGLGFPLGKLRDQGHPHVIVEHVVNPGACLGHRHVVGRGTPHLRKDVVHEFAVQRFVFGHGGPGEEMVDPGFESRLHVGGVGPPRCEILCAGWGNPVPSCQVGPYPLVDRRRVEQHTLQGHDDARGVIETGCPSSGRLLRIPQCFANP
mmetsp:Transcript_27271/g.50911  ORF Transcript_27271/g.50911 Transcript_27271/m.50911 type:complete len:269 (+) Transcript_27271:415-1221(+)